MFLPSIGKYDHTTMTKNCYSKQQKMKKDHKNMTSKNMLMATEVKCLDKDMEKNTKRYVDLRLWIYL